MNAFKHVLVKDCLKSFLASLAVCCQAQANLVLWLSNVVIQPLALILQAGVNVQLLGTIFRMRHIFGSKAFYGTQNNSLLNVDCYQGPHGDSMELYGTE